MKSCVSILDEVDAQLDKPVVIRNLPYCITLCLVSALVWTWSISWVPPLLGSRPTSPLRTFDFSILPESSIVVSCDSDRVEITRFETHHAESSPMIKKAMVQKLDIDIVNKITILTEQNSKELLAPLWELIEKAMNVKNEAQTKSSDIRQDNIFFGLVTDFNMLLKEGEMNSFQLGIFEQVTRGHFSSSNVHFDLLNFDSQALLELNAVRFAYDPVTIFNNNKLPADSFSCDWYSCLLASGTARPHHVVAIETDLKQALSMVAKVGETSTLLWWEEHIRNNPILKQYARMEPYHGNLVAITMVAHVAKLAVTESRSEVVFSVEDLLSSCSHFLEHVVLSGDADKESSSSSLSNENVAVVNGEETSDKSGKLSHSPHNAEEHLKKFINTLSIKRLMIILEELVDPSSLIYFQDPLNAADSLRIGWPLGAALAYPWGEEA